MVHKMRSAAKLFYTAVFAFVTVADASHASKELDTAKCAVSESWRHGGEKSQAWNDLADICMIAVV
jgi:hypothetical protein